MDFDYLVVGNGPFGSATARYLSQSNSRIVGLIGAAEPKDNAKDDDVFSSHYDARRLVRLLSRSKIRTIMGQIAFQKFATLEAQSGISFHEPVGALVVNSDQRQDNFLDSPLGFAQSLGVAHTLYDVGDMAWQAIAPAYAFPESHWVLHEQAPAGMVDPRAMIRAQNVIARQQGATLIADTVVDVKENDGTVQIETHSGTGYRAKRVVLATGAFTNCFDLVPRQLDLLPETELYVLGQVSAETAVSLKSHPTVAYYLNDPVLQHVYMAPPVQYPDGNYYIKMGANTAVDFNPNSLAELQTWFRSGDSDSLLADFERVLCTIMPTTEFLSFKMARCILTRTPTAYPMLDQLSDRIYVAAGGHGSGLLISDTVGWLMAGLIENGRWPAELPRHLFRKTLL